MNIGSNSKYPSSALSNFSGHRFVIDDVQCNSMEGFLQSLKFSSILMQQEVCKLVGLGAKFRGKKKKWYKTQTLYWKGVPMTRKSEAYQILLNRAYNAMYEQSDSFKKALHLTKGKLTHSIGKSKQNQTVLTTSEFCGRLMKLRDNGLLSPTVVTKKLSILSKPKYDLMVDFDSTLEFEDVQRFVRSVINGGYKVGVCTTRNKEPKFLGVIDHEYNEDLFKVTDMLKIARGDIYFTEHVDKAIFLKGYDVNILLDDCEHEIKQLIKRCSKITGVLYKKSNNWKNNIKNLIRNEKV